MNGTAPDVPSTAEARVLSPPSRHRPSRITSTYVPPQQISLWSTSLSARLGYRSRAESVSGSDGGSIAGSEGGGAGSDRELRPVPKENGEAKGQGGPNTHAFFVDRPQGTLPARQVKEWKRVCDRFSKR